VVRRVVAGGDDAGDEQAEGAGAAGGRRKPKNGVDDAPTAWLNMAAE